MKAVLPKRLTNPFILRPSGDSFAAIRSQKISSVLPPIEPLENFLMTRINKSFMTVLLCIGLVLSCVSSLYAQDKKPVIGLVMKSLANEFFKDMQEGAVKHVQERGDLTLVAVGMHSETDIDTQVNAVENFITKKVDGIVIAPAD